MLSDFELRLIDKIKEQIEELVELSEQNFFSIGVSKIHDLAVRIDENAKFLFRMWKDNNKPEA
jgi:hypothetical protein